MTFPTDEARWTSSSERILSFSNQLLQRTIDAWTRLLIDRASDESLDATTTAVGMNCWLEHHDRFGFPIDDAWRSLNPNDDIGALRWLLERCEMRATLQSTKPATFESTASISSSTSTSTPPTLSLHDAHPHDAPPHDATWKDLIESIHRAIGLLSTRDSFSESVERSARRQVHNLAYGLTHEINNPLGNIVARAQQLIRVVPTESDRRSMATIVDQAMRAHEMLAEVMRAVQPKDLQLVTTDLTALVRAQVESMRARAQEAKIEWSYHGPEEPIYANIDTDTLTEVLRLVGQNAIDVCPPHAMVVWDCRTELASSSLTSSSLSSSSLSSSSLSNASTVPPSSHSSHHRLPSQGSGIEDNPAPNSSDPHSTNTNKITSSDWVCITIRDTGPGLSASAARQATDLFYSGREYGRGLGVSLAVVRRTIESHRGRFQMRSENHGGCTIEIYLPMVDSPEPKRPRMRL